MNRKAHSPFLAVFFGAALLSSASGGPMQVPLDEIAAACLKQAGKDQSARQKCLRAAFQRCVANGGSETVCRRKLVDPNLRM